MILIHDNDPHKYYIYFIFNNNFLKKVTTDHLHPPTPLSFLHLIPM